MLLKTSRCRHAGGPSLLSELGTSTKVCTSYLPFSYVFLTYPFRPNNSVLVATTYRFMNPPTRHFFPPFFQCFTS